MAVKSMKRAIIPLISLFIFVISNGFFLTFTSLFLKKAGYSTALIGGMTTAFYAGLAWASLGVDNVIAKIGHIRAFSALVSGLAIVILLQGLFISPISWLIFRFFNGFFTAGLYIVIESWLLLLGNKRSRNTLLAIYMISLYAAQASGQFLINIPYRDPLEPFVLAAILCSLSLIPMAAMQIQVPSFHEPSRLNFFKLFQISGSGVICCFVSGLILSSIYGLLPIFLAERLGSVDKISSFMAALIFGGMSLQYPIGRLSDFIERRLMLMLISFALIVLLIPLIYVNNPYLLGLLIFLFGGFSFTLYPVAITLSCDNVNEKQIVAATQGLLLAYSIGCIVGPLISSFCMRLSPSVGYLMYFIVICFCLIIFLAIRRLQHDAVPQGEHFIPVPQTTPIAAELDPRHD